ncbi:rhomboid family intramembrane serine protease [Sphingosinicella soli]|uniref:Membrane associated rhomboid family serine protease n=1 Tax=Sphingosinicella soli TaxID=333708 RepID=A0A7W7B010_9SPHN|nr:membrane associated rhomboid family serine protease [Sphingosinicella soli]
MDFATRSIIIACVLIHLAVTLGGPAFEMAITLGGGLIPARISGTLVYDHAILYDHAIPAPATLVSSIFLHGSWAHLGFNMLFLAWIGRFVEAVLGRWRYLLLFFVSGIAGGLAQVALDPASPVPVVGASGAISGVFAAHAMIFGRSGGKGEFVRALQLAALWIGLQIATGFVFNMDGGGIAVGAHVGGFVAGLLTALPLARAAIEKRFR